MVGGEAALEIRVLHRHGKGIREIARAMGSSRPSDMAVGSPEQIEEERRLLYVAMTRAKQHLHLVQPLRFFRAHQHRHADGYILSIRSRFIPDGILDVFERHTHRPGTFPSPSQSQSRIRVNVAARMREMWN